MLPHAYNPSGVIEGRGRGEGGTGAEEAPEGGWRRAFRTAIRNLADAPDDADFQALLRAHIKRALLDDPALTADLARLLPAAGVAVTASGDGAVAVQNNSGVISTGSGATVQR
ncbi:hypothetical protein [Streptomyces sp. NPDC095613]|uniref:hypothetical protein n=1 Tax=Streptomyces sp. NPDC095613 TaxID=3155540 RepID=UPI003316E00F